MIREIRLSSSLTLEIIYEEGEPVVNIFRDGENLGQEPLGEGYSIDISTEDARSTLAINLGDSPSLRVGDQFVFVESENFHEVGLPPNPQNVMDIEIKGTVVPVPRSISLGISENIHQAVKSSEKDLMAIASEGNNYFKTLSDYPLEELEESIFSESPNPLALNIENGHVPTFIKHFGRVVYYGVDNEINKIYMVAYSGQDEKQFDEPTTITLRGQQSCTEENHQKLIDGNILTTENQDTFVVATYACVPRDLQENYQYIHHSAQSFHCVYKREEENNDFCTKRLWSFSPHRRSDWR